MEKGLAWDCCKQWGRLPSKLVPGEKWECRVSQEAAAGHAVAAWVCCYSLQPVALGRAEPLMLASPGRERGTGWISCL